MLTIRSPLPILLFSLPWADDVARGREPDTVSALGSLFILALWLSAAFLGGWTSIALGATAQSSFLLSTRTLGSLPRVPSK